MEINGMNGKLEVDAPNKTLSLEVTSKKRRNNAEQKPRVPLSSLSGGERSKTLVCFIISLWEHQSPPFRCLDEWDVFLDGVARAEVEKILYSQAKQSGYQHLFISPQKTTIEGVKVLELK